METIYRNLPLPLQPMMGNEEPLARFSQHEKETIYLWRAIPNYKATILVHDVLNVISERHGLHLTYDQSVIDAVVAHDGKTRYYLIGSWYDHRFTCRGLLKGRKNARIHHYLPNGQADTGTIQIEHYGEQLQIDYPDLREIYAKIATIF